MTAATSTPPGVVLDPAAHPTIAVEDAARVLGVSRSQGYVLASAGAWPVVRVSPRRMRVVTARFMREVLGLNPDGTAATT